MIPELVLAVAQAKHLLVTTQVRDLNLLKRVAQCLE